MFNVAVLTATTGNCRIEYAQSLTRLAMYFSMNRIHQDCDSQSFVADAVMGSGIGANYETLVARWLEKAEFKLTHVLFLEDDMGCEPDVLHILASRKLPIVGCNYSVNKGSPLWFTAMGLNDKRIVTRKNSTGVEEARWIPMGCTLVERQVFERTPRPWFHIGYNPTNYAYGTQDCSFCVKAKNESGFANFVDQDASKKVWHVGPKHYTYLDALASLEAEQEKENADVNIKGNAQPGPGHGSQEPSLCGSASVGKLDIA